jgi:hypothetical protein
MIDKFINNIYVNKKVRKFKTNVCSTNYNYIMIINY